MPAPTDLFSLAARRALVTGGRRGIGRAIARGLASAGAAVAISHVDEADADEAEAVVREIIDAGGQSFLVAGDLADPMTPSRLAADAVEWLGGLDILVANAAIDRRMTPDTFDPAAADVEWAVNVRATLSLALAVLPGMRERGWGRILLLGSVQQYRPNPNQLVYASTKAAIANIAENLAKQTAADGVTVNVLAPGAIATATNASVLADPGQRRSILGRIPMGRIGEPEDVAGAALFLCSDAARYVTGVVLLVDGGLHLG